MIVNGLTEIQLDAALKHSVNALILFLQLKDNLLRLGISGIPSDTLSLSLSLSPF